MADIVEKYKVLLEVNEYDLDRGGNQILARVVSWFGKPPRLEIRQFFKNDHEEVVPGKANGVLPLQLLDQILIKKEEILTSLLIEGK